MRKYCITLIFILFLLWLPISKVFAGGEFSFQYPNLVITGWQNNICPVGDVIAWALFVHPSSQLGPAGGMNGINGTWPLDGYNDPAYFDISNHFGAEDINQTYYAYLICLNETSGNPWSIDSYLTTGYSYEYEIITPTPTSVPTPTPTNNPTPTPTPFSITLNPVADSYIKQGSQNENEGASTFLRIQQSGKNRALVKFDETQIQAAVGNAQSYIAKLQFTITDNGNNWGTIGRTIDVHRLFQDWVEGNGFIDGNNFVNRGTGSGVTWNCVTDSNIANHNNDCSGSTAWNMDNSNLWPFASAISAAATIANNQTGVIEFNVTSDIQSFISGENNNYGWLIKKTDEGQAGRVSFGSKESNDYPRLIITNN